MAILPLEKYDRRVLIGSDGRLAYSTFKGMKLIVPGMIFGLRSSHDGKKIRCIIDDEINKVFTLTGDDYYCLYDNSISVEEGIKQGIIPEERRFGKGGL